MALSLLIILSGHIKLNQNIGLVLMSGGARGAYQAGALQAIAEISKTKTLPFPYLSGISAGSLNCSYLATKADDFSNAVSTLTHVWYNMKPKDIFNTNTLKLTKVGLSWIKDFSLGGVMGKVKGRSLLDTEPLRSLLTKNLDMTYIKDQIINGNLKGIAITATNYYTGTSVIFFDGITGIETWHRKMKMGVRTTITIDHLMASSAIPFFFPAVKINDAYYGDGCVRMYTPLSPVINMGAEKILAIGVRHERTIKTEKDLNTPYFLHYPYFAELSGVILNAIFLDSLEEDIEHAHSKNITALLTAKGDLSRLNFKYIPIMALKPSIDLESLVRKAVRNFPNLIQHFLHGMGASGETGWNLMSYLAFDSLYTSRLVELGYEDTLMVKNKLIDFMEL